MQDNNKELIKADAIGWWVWGEDDEKLKCKFCGEVIEWNEVHICDGKPIKEGEDEIKR